MCGWWWCGVVCVYNSCEGSVWGSVCGGGVCVGVCVCGGAGWCACMWLYSVACIGMYVGINNCSVETTKASLYC